MKDKEDHFKILRTIKKNPNSSQRMLADEADVSLGKLNYCLKALKEKGFIKIKNFKKSKKTNYIYVLTPKDCRKNKINNQFYETKNEKYN